MAGTKAPEIIVAVGRNNEIGCENRLLWPIREDLRHFKAVTLGHPVIMGRKTWESLPKRPLPGRLNVVVTRNTAYQAPGALTAPSLEKALELIQQEENTPFIIGGGSLYAEAIPLATTLHLTRVDAEEPKADTWFPEIPAEEWQLSERSEDMTTPDGLTFRFETYTRKTAATLA